MWNVNIIDTKTKLLVNSELPFIFTSSKQDKLVNNYSYRVLIES